MPRPSTDTRERLLAAVVDYAAEHRLADLSLRPLAAALGTSHRMLIFHFGSKEGLLVEVVPAVEPSSGRCWSGFGPIRSWTCSRMRSRRG